MITGPIATHPIVHTNSEPAAATAPLGGALGEDTAEMCVFETNGYDKERDYCIPEDETGAAAQGVYVSLVKNPERFTGYSGEHAHAVWREIYRENCFEMQTQDTQEEEKEEVQDKESSGGSAMSDLEAVM